MCLFIASLGNKMRYVSSVVGASKMIVVFDEKTTTNTLVKRESEALLLPILSIHARVNRRRTIDTRCAREHFT